MSTEEKIIGRVCPQCGRVLEETWKSCPYCGKDLIGTQKPSKGGRTWAIISIIFGVVSFIVFGIPLGLAAIICGAVAVTKENKLGIVGIILGVIGAVLALIILLAVF